MSPVTHFARHTVCLRRRLHARLGVKVLKGFQLLFVPRSGVNHVSVRLWSSLLFPRDPFNRELRTARMVPSAVYAAFNSRLTPFEHNFHNDMREQERSSCAQPAAWLHLTYRTYRADQAADDHRSSALYARLWNQYSPGIMSIPVGEPPTIVSQRHNIDIVLCPCRRYQKSSVLVKRRKRESRRNKVQRTLSAGQIATFSSTPSLLRL